MIAAEGTGEYRQCCLMNRSIGVHRACDKATVGLVRPSATGLDRGHGSLRGFTPLLLCKHTEPSDWSGTPSNQRPPCPLRTIAAGSASARSFIGSSARIFYMNQRASYAFFLCFLCFLRALLQTIKMQRKARLRPNSMVVQLSAILQEVKTLGPNLSAYLRNISK